MGFPGAAAVRYARGCVESEVLGSVAVVPEDPEFTEARGVFVTLSEHQSGGLRGCIGYPYPVMPLADAIDASARSVCHDPRFPDLSACELDSVIVEVTVLSVPERIFGTQEEIRKCIVIACDGLILEYCGHRGLLLPQVPVEWGWDVDEFLSHLSMKAGMASDAWAREGAMLWRFGGEAYVETSPRGDVERRDLSGH